MESNKANNEEISFELTKPETFDDDEIHDDTGDSNRRELIIVKILLITATITATINYGLGSGYSAVLLPQLKSTNETLHVDEEMGSWIASIPSIASPFGAISSGILMDRVGRKLTLQIQNGIAVLAWILITVCQTHTLLLLGRFIGGVASGITLVAAPIFIAEVTDPNMRGMFSVVPAISQSFGILLVYILGATLHRRLVAGLCIIPPIVSIFTSFILPESPVWLVRHGQVDRARKACLWYRANNVTQAKQEVQQIINRTENEKYQQEHSQEISFFSAQILKPLIIVNIFNVLQTFSGWYQFILYAVEIISLIIGEQINEFFAAVMTAGIRLVFTIVAVFALAYMGRRTISIYSDLCCGLSAFSLGIAMYFNYKTHDYLLIVCLLLYIASATIAFPTMSRVMIGELFPARARAAVGSISMVICGLLMFGFAKLFPILKQLIGIHGLFMLFGAASFSASIFMYYMLPETKGKTLNEIEDYFLQDNILWTSRNKKCKNLPKTINTSTC